MNCLSCTKVLAIVGLGYVGLPLAVEFGKKYSVIGFDVNEQRIADLKSGLDRTFEVSKSELELATSLKYTSNPRDLLRAQIYIVTVPTPIDEVNRPDLNPLIKASQLVAGFLKEGDIVIYESTVYPGCTEEVCVPILENISGLKFNIDFFCGYSPERINPGDKKNTLTKVKKIISGSNPVTIEEVNELYSSIIAAGTYVAPTIKVAEAAKVIENSQRDLNIAFVNELSVIFERLGIDTLEVLEAAESKWNFLSFRPGMVGGHCIGVDPYYLTHKAEEVGYHPQVILAGRRINDSMGPYAARSIIQRMVKNGIDISKATVGVMGITFKENCPDIRNSKIVDLVKELQTWNIDVVISDPWADPEELKKAYGLDLGLIDEAHPVDSLVVAVGHQVYRNLEAKTFKKYCRWNRQPVFADLKSLYKVKDLSDLDFTVFRL